MKISIRDDDPNYFTAFADLQQAYGRFFGVLPVTFAVIPFVCDSYHRMLSIEGPSRKERLQKQTEMVLALSAAEFADTQRHYPVGDNHELVAGLNSMITSGTGEVGLHGYNHRYYDDGAEFIKNHVNFFNVRDGLHYLNILFGDTVTSFVPPSNKINFKYLNILRRLNLNLISSSGIDCDNFKEFIQLISMKIWHNPSFVLYKLTRKPLHSYHYSGITLLHSKTFGLNDTAESYLRRNLNHAEQLGYLSIATHYMTLKGDDRYRTEFYNLLDILIDRYGKDAFVLSRDLIKHVGRL